MPVISNWKLTFDPGGTPLVILDFGQAFEGEFSFPWRQISQQSNRVRAGRGKRYARGNSSGGIQFTALKDHADDAAARLWCLEANIECDNYSGVTSTLLLEIANSARTFSMSDASIDDCDPRMRIAGVARTHTAWDIGGSGWVELP